MSLIFECEYCPDSFKSFKELVRHYETKHNKEGEQFQYRTDKEYYQDVDSGCQQATDYLGGKQSSCLKCPFRKCAYDDEGGLISAQKRNRDVGIRARRKAGAKIKDLAKYFGLSERTIERIVK